MDLVRLAIVYDTGQAASSLQQLDRQLATVQGRTGTTHAATRGLEGALRSMAVQATGVSGPVGHLSTALLGLGTSGNIVIGVLAGVAAGYALFVERSKQAREETDKLVQSLASVSRASAAFDVGTANIQLTAAQEQLQRMTERRAFLEKQINIGGPAGQAMKTAARLVAGVTDADFQDQQSRIQTLTQLARAYEEKLKEANQHAAEDARDRWAREFLAGVDIGIGNAIAHLKYASFVAANPDLALRTIPGRPDLYSLAQPRIQMGPMPSGGFQPTPFAGNQTYQGFQGLSEDVNRLGMTMEDLGRADADLADNFKLAGKAVMDFVGFLAQALGVLFPNDPALGFAVSGIASVVSSVGHASGSTGGGSISGRGGGSRPELVTNVNFNVAAMDAQGVATWVQTNGAQIAAEVTRQADRSRSIRRRFLRG